MLLLDVRELSKSFTLHALQRQLPIFAGLSFQLHTGEFFRVAGPNGAGKSTLLRCLYRTYRPTGGEAWLASNSGPIDLVRAADVDVGVLRRGELGNVSQFLRPRPRVSALDLVAEPLAAQGESWSAAGEQARGMLERFGLSRSLWEAYPTTFSGGEQQKVNLARALILPRRLLLLDEPTASLDEASRQALVERLRELKAAGTAMLGVFHHPEEVAGLVDGTLEIPKLESDPLVTNPSN